MFRLSLMLVERAKPLVYFKKESQKRSSNCKALKNTISSMVSARLFELGVLLPVYPILDYKNDNFRMSK